jgi:hypothetical protein
LAVALRNVTQLASEISRVEEILAAVTLSNGCERRFTKRRENFLRDSSLFPSTIAQQLPCFHPAIHCSQVVALTPSSHQVESKFNEIEKQRAPKTITRTVRFTFCISCVFAVQLVRFAALEFMAVYR